MKADLAKDNIKSLYLRYLANAFGAALISAMFGVVDMAMMGHYQGPNGPAALAIISPIWNLVYSLGLLTGIGSSVLYAALKGDEEETEDPRQFFTIGLILTLILGALEALILNLALKPLLRFYGADDTTLPLCLSYLLPIRYVFPLFTLSNFLAAFLRNDKAPTLASIGVISGGIFNIIFDYLFIFTFNMGMQGAGLATALGIVLSCGLLSSHFFSKKNTLKLVRFHGFAHKSGKILFTGFSAFFVDVAMGIVNIAFNRQIVAFCGDNANTYLAIYGVLVNLYVFVQCACYGIGQAAQPLWSFNYGAGLFDRVKKVLRYSVVTLGVLTLLSLAISESIPSYLIQLFMTPTAEVLSLAPSLMRPFCLCFLFLPLNTVSCYYFQATLHEKTSFLVSICRGALVPLLFIYTLPYGNPALLWWSLTFSDTVVGIYVIFVLIRITKRMGLPNSDKQQLSH